VIRCHQGVGAVHQDRRGERRDPPARGRRPRAVSGPDCSEGRVWWREADSRADGVVVVAAGPHHSTEEKP